MFDLWYRVLYFSSSFFISWFIGHRETICTKRSLILSRVKTGNSPKIIHKKHLTTRKQNLACPTDDPSQARTHSGEMIERLQALYTSGTTRPRGPPGIWRTIIVFHYIQITKSIKVLSRRLTDQKNDLGSKRKFKSVLAPAQSSLCAQLVAKAPGQWRLIRLYGYLGGSEWTLDAGIIFVVFFFFLVRLRCWKNILSWLCMLSDERACPLGDFFSLHVSA